MDEPTRLRQAALVEALAGEHRLRRLAVREEQEIERWRRRAAFAEERRLVDLAASARARVARHERMVRHLRQQADALHHEVERLRAGGSLSRAGGRAPPTGVASLEARLAALEDEAEIDRVRRLQREGPQSPLEGS